MFLKQEKPEMDNFERKKNLVLKEKYLENVNKNVTKYFRLFFCFRTFEAFFLFLEKKLVWQVATPPECKFSWSAPLKESL